VEVLSGDRQEVCDWAAAAVGADGATGGVLLAEKITCVAERRRAGQRVLYVGDGTNDALAMREADAAVAVAGATDAALTASGVVMLHGRLGELPVLVQTARRLSRVVRQNFSWALASTPCSSRWPLPLAPAAAGHGLMLASSVGVLLNSLRMARVTADARGNDVRPR